MKDLEMITMEMAEYVCDKLCIHHKMVTDQDEMNRFCAGCKMEQFVRQIEEAVD